MSTRESFKRSTLAVLVANACALISAHAANITTDTLTTDKVHVISATPLPSLGVPITVIPAPVQVIKAKDIQQSQSLDLTEYLNRHAASVYVNEIQNNPLQPDINYRGFTASPLLGTPQGLSIYVDGVRMNQPFGDVVSWDLIPKNAIAGIQIMPGSNPLFGLNTLGGALSIQTKNGRDNAGGAVQTTFGSYGRKIGEFEYGGYKDELDWFIAGTYFDENGWRDHSESDAKNIFGKLGWHNDKTALKLTYSYADTDLNGNGLTPKSFLRRDYASVYTYPDNTQNRSNFINLQWDHYFTDNVAFSGNAYYRKIRTHTFNGDINDESLPEEAGGAGQSILPLPRPSAGPYSAEANMARCRGEFNPGDEPGEKCTGIINRTKTVQENAGIFGQVSVKNQLAGKDNNFVLGAGYDVSRVAFKQSAEFGSLTVDRGINGSGIFATADKAFNLDGELDDRAANLKSRTNTWSLYGTDTVNLADGLNLTAAGRYNHVRVNNRDQDVHYELNGNALSNVVDEDASLTGKHTFSRFNPAVGLSFSPTSTLNTYVGYNEGSRAPTSIELGCANPDAPCRLPNSMAGDPPLKQVVSKTWEAGLRGVAAANLRWNAGVFSTRNVDDIMFISATSGSGYFDNVGETQRRGFETGMNAVMGDWSLGANYTYLDASYRSNETVLGAANSSNNDGRLNIKSGDRIPMIPRNILKAFANYRVSERFNLGTDMIVISSSYVRGNENNEHQSGGLYYGKGKIGGYAVVNLSAAFQINPQWSVFARVNNVFDREYATAGMLGLSPFDMATGAFRTDGKSARGVVDNTRSNAVGETFVAPGAPRTGWIGVRWEFSPPKQVASN